MVQYTKSHFLNKGAHWRSLASNEDKILQGKSPEKGYEKVIYVDP